MVVNARWGVRAWLVYLCCAALLQLAQMNGVLVDDSYRAILPAVLALPATVRRISPTIYRALLKVYFKCRLECGRHAKSKVLYSLRPIAEVTYLPLWSEAIPEQA